jgi:hypothetical protein
MKIIPTTKGRCVRLKDVPFGAPFKFSCTPFDPVLRLRVHGGIIPNDNPELAHSVRLDTGEIYVFNGQREVILFPDAVVHEGEV